MERWDLLPLQMDGKFSVGVVSSCSLPRVRSAWCAVSRRGVSSSPAKCCAMRVVVSSLAPPRKILVK